MSLILGLIIHYNYYVGTLSLIGYLPLSGPGNYFISIVLEFILIFPIMYYIYKRNSMILLVLSFIISLLFELLANQLHMNGETYIYNACVLRYLFVIALGIYAADALKTTNLSFFKKNKIWVFIVISIAYMFWVSALGNHLTIIPEYWQPMIFLSFFYTFFLCALGLRYLPKNSNKFIDKVSLMGKASYHIYLVQIVAFYILSSIPSITRLFPKIVVSIGGIFFILAIGTTFYAIEKKFL